MTDSACERFRCLGVCQGDAIVLAAFGTKYEERFQYYEGGELRVVPWDVMYGSVQAAIDAVLGLHWKGGVVRIRAEHALPVLSETTRYMVCRRARDRRAVVSKIEGLYTGLHGERFLFKEGAFKAERFATAVFETPREALVAHQRQVLQELDDLEKKKKILLAEMRGVSEALSNLEGVHVVSPLFIGDSWDSKTSSTGS